MKASRSSDLVTNQTADRTDDLGEPDVIVWGRDDDSTSPRTPGRSHDAQQSSPLRRLRRFAEPALLVAGISAAIMAMQIADDRGAQERIGALRAAPAAPPVPQVQLRLVAPATAAPGQRIVVLAFKDEGLCGRAELRFDGAPVQHRLTGIAGSPLPDRVEMFLGMQVPRSTPAGLHTLDLYSLPASSSVGSACAQIGEHRARLATTTIAVAGTAGSPGGAPTATGDDRPLPSIGPPYAPSTLNMLIR